MIKPKQALTWWTFVREGMTAQRFVAEAARIGYAGLELIPEEHWSMVRDAGLRIVTSRGHESLHDGMNQRRNHERIEHEILENLDLAVKWQIPALICFSGNRNELDDATGAAATAEILRRVAAAAEQAEVTLVVELLNSKVDHPDYQCDKTPWGVQVCQQVNSPGVKLLYDIYHMQIMEGDLVRTIQQNHHWFGHYHTAGNPGRHELDESQEINYPPVFRAIRDTGYDGFISHEFIPVGEPVAGMEAAFKLCEEAYEG